MERVSLELVAQLGVLAVQLSENRSAVVRMEVQAFGKKHARRGGVGVGQRNADAVAS
jgi:hypothetical protein